MFIRSGLSMYKGVVYTWVKEWFIYVHIQKWFIYVKKSGYPCVKEWFIHIFKGVVYIFIKEWCIYDGLCWIRDYVKNFRAQNTLAENSQREGRSLS